MSHLWGQPPVFFRDSPDDGEIRSSVTVETGLATSDPADYCGFLLTGAYAMDRFRSETSPNKGQPNGAPAVELMRSPGVKVGTICHGMWLLCADRALLEGRRVTCAHNIVCDVANAGAEVVFEGDATAELIIDGDLISGKHPGMVARFMDVFRAEIESTNGVSHGDKSVAAPSSASSVDRGRPLPFGATLDDTGCNFSIYSRHATQFELLFFATHDEVTSHRGDPTGIGPAQAVSDLEIPRRRTVGTCYAYRVDGPDAIEYFDRDKVLIDPYEHFQEEPGGYV